MVLHVVLCNNRGCNLHALPVCTEFLACFVCSTHHLNCPPACIAHLHDCTLYVGITQHHLVFIFCNNNYYCFVCSTHHLHGLPACTPYVGNTQQYLHVCMYSVCGQHTTIPTCTPYVGITQQYLLCTSASTTLYNSNLILFCM